MILQTECHAVCPISKGGIKCVVTLVSAVRSLTEGWLCAFPWVYEMCHLIIDLCKTVYPPPLPPPLSMCSLIHVASISAFQPWHICIFAGEDCNVLLAGIFTLWWKPKQPIKSNASLTQWLVEQGSNKGAQVCTSCSMWWHLFNNAVSNVLTPGT